MCRVEKGTQGFFAYKLDRRQGRVHSSVFHFECRKDTLKEIHSQEVMHWKVIEIRLRLGVAFLLF